MASVDKHESRTEVEVMVDMLNKNGTCEEQKNSCVEIRSVHESELTESERIDQPESELLVITGWRWAVLMISLLLGLFLATIETSISATALVNISQYFNDFPNTTWVVLSYLLGYLSFAIVTPRLSDVIGCRAAVLGSWVIFAAFSLGCGLSQSLNQLIICRAFQGIGGTGLFSMTLVIIPKVTPVPRWAFATSLSGITVGTASVLGPVIGGLITQRASWRWIYIFNTPFIVASAIPLIFLWPKKKDTKAIRQSWKNIDILGCILLISASCLIVFGLHEAGAGWYGWNDAIIISSLVVSGVSWILFALWTTLLSRTAIFKIDPIFPGSIAVSRPAGPAILVSVLIGFSFFTSIITLPERYQIVNGMTPIGAGIRLIPLLAFTAIGSVVAGLISGKRNRTSETVIAGSSLVTIGCGLLSTISHTEHVDPKQYVYQAILGLGLGVVVTGLILMMNIEHAGSLVAAAQGSVNQARFLGGTLALAITTIVLNRKLTHNLQGVVSEALIQQIRRSLSSVELLAPGEKLIVAKAFAEAFSQQLRICTYVSIGATVVSIATWTKDRTQLPKFRVS